MITTTDKKPVVGPYTTSARQQANRDGAIDSKYKQSSGAGTQGQSGATWKYKDQESLGARPP